MLLEADLAAVLAGDAALDVLDLDAFLETEAADFEVTLLLLLPLLAGVDVFTADFEVEVLAELAVLAVLDLLADLEAGALAMVDLAVDLPAVFAVDAFADEDFWLAGLAAVLETALDFVVAVLAAVVLDVVALDEALDFVASVLAAVVLAAVDLGAALDFVAVLVADALDADDFLVVLVDVGLELVDAVLAFDAADLATDFDVLEIDLVARELVADLGVALVLLELLVGDLALVLTLALEAGLAVDFAVELDAVDFLVAVDAVLALRAVDVADDRAVRVVLLPVDLRAAVLFAVDLLVVVLDVDAADAGFPASSFRRSAIRFLAIISSNPAVFHLLLIDNPTVRLFHVVLSTA